MAPPATPAKRLFGRLAPVFATQTTLKATPVTDETHVDGCLCPVADNTLWQFNASSSATAAADVLVPDNGSGRFLRVAAFEGVPVDSTEDAITAGTTRTQAGAYALTKEISRIGTSTAPSAGSLLGDGVKLMASVAGMRVAVINNTANPVQVYGAGSDTINGIAGATGIAIPPKSVQLFSCPLAAAWHVDPGFGFAGALPTLLSVTGITAGTTRTQAGATLLAADVNRVDTSTAPAAGAVLGDGVALPASAAGLAVVVINNTANPIQLYGTGADTVNGVTNTTGIAVPANSVMLCAAAAAGSWQAQAGMGASGALPTFLAASGITAGTTRTQAGATALPGDFNRVSTSTAPAAGAILGDGVKLPAAATGLDVVVVNDTANPIQAYGAGSDTVNGVAAATGIALPAKSVVMFTCSAAASGWQAQVGAGTSGALATRLSADAVTAAGTTQATGTQLSALVNTIGTVAGGTGVNLPAAAAGLQVSIINAGLNPLLVYPVQGGSETINGVAAATGVSILPGANAEFTATSATAWTTLPASAKQAAFNTTANADAAFVLTAAQITGGTASVDLHMTGAITAGRNAQLPTVASMVLAMHSPTVGSSFRLRLVNFQGGAFPMTVVTNTGWTITGTPTIAQNTWREFVVTLTSLTTATIQNVAVGTIS